MSRKIRHQRDGQHSQHSQDHDKGTTDHVKKHKHEASIAKAEHIKKEIINKRTKPSHEQDQHAASHNRRAARSAPNKRKHVKHTESAVTLA